MSNTDITRKHNGIEHYFTIVSIINELIHAQCWGFFGKKLGSISQVALSLYLSKALSLSGNQFQIVSVTQSVAFPINPFRMFWSAGTNLNCISVRLPTQRPDSLIIPNDRGKFTGEISKELQAEVLTACSVHGQAIFLTSCKFLIFYIFLKTGKAKHTYSLA